MSQAPHTPFCRGLLLCAGQPLSAAAERLGAGTSPIVVKFSHVVAVDNPQKARQSGSVSPSWAAESTKRA